MAKKIIITDAQLQSIADLAGDIEGMLGGGGDVENKEHGDPDKFWIRHLRNINKMFVNNGYKKPTQVK